MKMHEVVVWVEENPGKSVIIGGVSVIVLIWLLGGFSKTASADNGQTSLAAAYYAAEAQQAVVGGQIQMANIGATASTAQAKIAADAATAINAQNTSTASQINDTNNATLITVGGQQLQATQNNNATLLAAQQAHNSAVLTMNDANNSASLMSILLGKIIPQELAQTGGSAAFDLSNFGLGSGAVNFTGVVNRNDLLGQGYSPNQADYLLGIPSVNASA